MTIGTDTSESADAHPHLRLSTPEDRDAILAFIEQSGFNPRDEITWEALQMQAMTAWLKDELIGVIPFEPRRFIISPTRSIPIIHETVVALHPDNRNRGLGSMMQQSLFNHRPGNAEMVTVFREDPASPAYRWYLRNGFTSLMPIQSWFCDSPIGTEKDYSLHRVDDAHAPVFPFDENRWAGQIGRALLPWLAVHPYRNRYDFRVLTTSTGSAALLGIGTLHSRTVRADVLDLYAEGEEEENRLIQCILSAAAANNWTPVRIPLATADPVTRLVEKSGFASRWSFDLLAKSLDPLLDLKGFDTASWRYTGVDYI